MFSLLYLGLILGSGEENISIIVAPIFPGFKLSSLGEPQEQAKWFLSNIAYEGSGKKATLVNARSRWALAVCRKGVRA